MATAQCACGALRLMLNEPPQLTALCHCFACQRRTGAPFSANAFYSIDCVEISGVSTEYIRTAESGRKVRMHFCPSCGSTLYWKDPLLESRCFAVLDRGGGRVICRPELRPACHVSIRAIET
jgi:hypothetical protein